MTLANEKNCLADIADLLGSVGFELIAIFGILEISGREWASYQANLTTIWGSAAYLISSALQWYEALNKGPVEELFRQ